MKTRKNQKAYKLPPFGQIISVTVRDGLGPHYRLVCLRELLEESKKPEMPQYFAIEGERIVLFPTPDKGYELKVIFYPPAQEA